MAIARVQTDDREFNQFQSNVITALQPLLTNSLLNGNQLKGISLINGSTIVNHGLGRVQQGWIITDIDDAAEIYRTGDFNSTTMVLVSDADVTVNIYVY